MAIISKYTIITICIAVFFTSAGCARKSPHAKLVEYIKAEKDLRDRLGNESSISDSIKVLGEKYGIDLNESLAELTDDPEAWLDILQNLKNAK